MNDKEQSGQQSERVLTDADLDAIRKTIFETVPVGLMDTQRIVMDNQKLRAEVAELHDWINSGMLDHKRTAPPKIEHE